MDVGREVPNCMENMQKPSVKNSLVYFIQAHIPTPNTRPAAECGDCP